MRCKTGARGYMFKLIFSNYLLTTIFFSHRIYRGARFPENRWNFAIRVWVGWGGGGGLISLFPAKTLFLHTHLKLSVLTFIFLQKRHQANTTERGKSQDLKIIKTDISLCIGGLKIMHGVKKKIDWGTGLDKGGYPQNQI